VGVAGSNPVVRSIQSEFDASEGELTLWAMVAIGGTALVILLAAWLIRRSQRDIEGYHEEEYRDPPVFGTPDGVP
jgi:hypothetical protein